jgi:hypothetical protein
VRAAERWASNPGEERKDLLVKWKGKSRVKVGGDEAKVQKEGG